MHKMKVTSQLRCLCEGSQFTPVFIYETPPKGETRFLSSSASYRREVLRCDVCGHFVSVHEMDADTLYTGDYVTATYGKGGIHQAFERIVALDPEKSDNIGRVRRILDFSKIYFNSSSPRDGNPSVLDVGSGLCVFLHRMKTFGWECTALDPDIRSIEHAKETVGVKTIFGDFMEMDDFGRFDVVTFNKVLEHVKDPIAMLEKTLAHVKPEGFVYVEVPDGEMAVSDGPEREEFFIEHWHIFSATSVALLASRAGFSLRALERLREPSNKYTLRAFLVGA